MFYTLDIGGRSIYHFSQFAHSEGSSDRDSNVEGAKPARIKYLLGTEITIISGK